MILSYHLLLFWIFSPITGTCHVTALWCGWFFGCLFRFLFVVLFLGVFPVFLAERDSHRTMYRSSTSLLLRPLQEWPLRDLIKLLILIATCSQTC